MKSEWREMPLGEIAHITTGKLNSNAAVMGGKYPFFTCSPEVYRIDSYAFDEEAILLAGNNAEGNFNIKYYQGKFNTYQRTYVITVKDIDNINLKYIYYALKLCLQRFKLLSQGTSTKFLTLKILNSFCIEVPPLQEQEQIVYTLTNLDDKIELNQRINNNLERQAQVAFQELFVDNARSDWQEGTISNLGMVIGGSTPSKAKPEYYTDQGIAWITPKDLSLNKSKFISHGENDITELGLKNSSATIMPAGTVLFSSRAPIGYIAIAAGEVTTNQGFKSVVPKPEVGTAYVYYFLKHNLPIIEGMASGSTFKEVSGAVMKSVPTQIPNNDTLAKFNAFCEPLFAQQKKLEEENCVLARLRDTLLPKLMSGEIDMRSVNI